VIQSSIVSEDSYNALFENESFGSLIDGFNQFHKNELGSIYNRYILPAL